jgi:hypothetical protein
MRTVAGIVLALAAAIGATVGPAVAPAVASEPTCLQVTWQAVAADCAWTYAEYQQSSSSGDAHTWVVSIQCGNGGICTEYIECVEGAERGFMHDVFMDGTDVGDVCVPESEVDETNIAQLIIRQFRNISWPDSNLVVQPPKGQTLVNFETNFYTLDKQPIDQTVIVANRPVEIRATPTSYTFDFGDGEVTTTTSPGRPHPNLDVTHVYEQLGKVSVRLDTTYSGEYRIGNGNWVAIPETLTVAGEPQDLEILEALPQLVIR